MDELLEWLSADLDVVGELETSPLQPAHGANIGANETFDDILSV